jgi:hypothetical protein
MPCGWVETCHCRIDGAERGEMCARDLMFLRELFSGWIGVIPDAEDNRAVFPASFVAQLLDFHPGSVTSRRKFGKM